MLKTTLVITASPGVVCRKGAGLGEKVESRLSKWIPVVLVDGCHLVGADALALRIKISYCPLKKRRGAEQAQQLGTNLACCWPAFGPQHQM